MLTPPKESISFPLFILLLDTLPMCTRKGLDLARICVMYPNVHLWKISLHICKLTSIGAVYQGHDCIQWLL